MGEFPDGQGGDFVEELRQNERKARQHHEQKFWENFESKIGYRGLAEDRGVVASACEDIIRENYRDDPWRHAITTVAIRDEESDAIKVKMSVSRPGASRLQTEYDIYNFLIRSSGEVEEIVDPKKVLRSKIIDTLDGLKSHIVDITGYENLTESSELERRINQLNDEVTTISDSVAEYIGIIKKEV